MGLNYVEETTFEGEDFAKTLFEISRSEDNKLTYLIERLWAGDVARYIVDLENKIAFLEDSINSKPKSEKKSVPS
jgi:hypothetical protein